MINYLKILRPAQWLKNLMIFFPPFLGGSLFIQDEIIKGCLPFFSFCLASSATYIINDLFDAEVDAHHPQKKKRPIPSQQISKNRAAFFAIVLFVFALLSGIVVSDKFLLIVLGYIFLTLSYSAWLKKIAVVDLLCISTGFLLRLFAGGEVFSTPISEWLFLCVFFLSFFLSAGKRYGELLAMGPSVEEHRKSLVGYPPGALEGLMYMSGVTVLVVYVMYITTNPELIYTVPLCTFGLLRYIVRVKSGHSGDPTESLLKDVPLLVTGGLWAIMVGWSIY